MQKINESESEEENERETEEVPNELPQTVQQHENEENNPSRRRFWVKPFLENRRFHDIEHNLIKDLLAGGISYFKNFLRMEYSKFERLHSMGSVMYKGFNTYLLINIYILTSIYIYIYIYYQTGQIF